MVEVEMDELAQFAGAKPFVVVGIPAFNEEKTIARVVLEAQRHADVVVVCDDGSSDLTSRIAQRLGADVVRHEQNLGYGAAVKSLFERARELGADVLVTLDGDGQHNPDEIPSVVQPVISGVADIAVGSRFIDKRVTAVVPWYRRAGIRFISRLVDTRTKGVLDAQSGFRAYSCKCLDGLVMAENGMGASVEILMSARKQGLRILEVPASCDYGADLKKHVRNPVRHGTDVLMSIIRLVVEERPLVMLGVPGILCLMAGAGFGVWMLDIYAAEHAITTNIALASIGFLMIGFFCLSTAITLYAISRLTERNSRKG